MSNEKTTPGPWYVQRQGSYGTWYITAPNTPFNIFASEYSNVKTAEANAKLASQAPVLRDIVEKQWGLINFMIRNTTPSFTEQNTFKERIKEIETLKQSL